MAFLTDTCTDTTGTLLSAHTGELGATWTKHPNAGAANAVITAGGRLRSSTNFTIPIYYASGVPASADYDVEADLYVASIVAGQVIAICGRMSTSANTMYYAGYSTYTNEWTLQKIVAGGSAVVLGTNYAQTLTAGQTYHVKLQMRGTALTLFIDGVSRITATDSSITAAGRIGVRPYTDTAPTDSNGIHMDNLSATDAPAAPTNIAVPTITYTGTPGDGTVLTGHLGSWSGTPTSYAYEFRRNGVTIAGTAGTTSSSATTSTYTLSKGDVSFDISFHVTATNATGTSAMAASAFVVPYSPKVPFRTGGNPWLTALPGGVAYDTTLTNTLQTQLQAWYAAGKQWFPQGGNYGSSWSSFLHIVDSSMPRTPWVLSSAGGAGSVGTTEYTTARWAQVQNGTMKEHLAWTLGTKNGGIPTPPGGWQIPAPSDNITAGTYGDRHLCVYCTDTNEYWEIWRATYNPTNPNTGTQHADYTNQYVASYGGYIRDVTVNEGYWWGSASLTDSNGAKYHLDTDGNREYANWGAMATSLPYFQATIQERELNVDNAITHAIGLVMPGSNNTHLWPAQRHDVGSGSNLPQGGIWTIDPAFDPTSLATTGNTNADAFRLMVLNAIKTYGIIPVDSTGASLSFRMEALPYDAATDAADGSLNGVPGSLDWPIFTQTVDAMMKQVPVSSWRFVTPSYRPSGATITSPKTSAFSDTFSTLDLTRWAITGGATSVSGRLSIPVTSGGATVQPAEGYIRSVVADTAMVQLVQAVGATCQFDIRPNSSTAGAAFVYSATDGTLQAKLADTSNAAVGTQSSVTYNATNHAWLRFRESGGNLYWETSPGGASSDPSTWTWTTLRTATPPWDMNNVGQTFYVQGTSGTALFDNLNVSTVASSFSRTAADTITVSDTAVGVMTPAGGGGLASYRRRVGTTVAKGTVRAHWG